MRFSIALAAVAATMVMAAPVNMNKKSESIDQTNKAIWWRRGTEVDQTNKVIWWRRGTENVDIADYETRWKPRDAAQNDVDIADYETRW